MTSRRNTRQQRKRRRSAGAAALIAHRAFAPVMGLWGALLGGLVVLVLPGRIVAALIAGSAIAAWPALAQLLLAVIAAMLVGGALFLLARQIGQPARRAYPDESDDRPYPARYDQDADGGSWDDGMQPIDPARDLGIGSLDDPVETMPCATPALRDVGAAPMASPAAPQELDLAGFAEFPGRDAVRVEAPSAPLERSAAPVATLRPAGEPQPPRRVRLPDPSAAALERLRAMPTSELSLAEMVERFAGAMHEHRTTAEQKGLTPADLAAREAALAQALKALATLSRDGVAEGGDYPLRDALARLQELRGAA